jgi:large subunit ribosomal protein L3
MIDGLIGCKRGMTQIFMESGEVIPVTVLEVGPCPVTQIKTDKTDGYEAVQVGFGAILKKRQPRATKEKFKALADQARKLPGQDKLELRPQRLLREFKPLAAGKLPEVGQFLDVSLFEGVKMVKVTGVSKGKGSQGVVRRHKFSGGGAAHGSCFHRRPGAIGCRAFPGRIHKGKRMGGHMGSEQVTQVGLTVVKTDKDRNLLFIKGSVPGPINGYVTIHRVK